MSTDFLSSDSNWNLENTYADLPELFYSPMEPNRVKSPQLVILNEPLTVDLGLDIEALQSREGIEILAGNKAPHGSVPLAQAYAGHQFGHFTMLGDGRALLFGEQITPTGERYDIQLKGSGPTPYSRGGDGRAALGPMLREYIISEAMHALNIPTSRSLAVVTSGEKVYREKVLTGAVLTRVAASHIRVGTFEYASHWGSEEDLKSLADYTLNRYFPGNASGENKYLYLLKEVIKRQAMLIAKWLLVGFIHGVMNTDNMLLSGETIDYGPCAFMDTYDPATVFSSIDRQGRYAYGNQPHIAKWNLARLAETLLPLLDEDQESALEIANEALDAFDLLFRGNWLAGMRTKLGLTTEAPEDEALIENLLSIMKKYKADYTNTFRALTTGKLDEMDLFAQEKFAQWHEAWLDRLAGDGQSLESAQALMKVVNPAIIPRNHRVEEALTAAEIGDFTLTKRLLEVLANPFAYSTEQEEYALLPAISSGPYRTFCGT